MMNIDGESKSGSHTSWEHVDGFGSSSSGDPPPNFLEGEGGSTSESGGSPPPGKPGGGVNPTAIVLVGLMLAAIATVAVLANRGPKDNSPEAEEIVFEPEVVILEKGNALLTASYSAEDSEYFDVYGEDEIQLTIVKNPEREDYYDVDGSMKSVQNVTTYGMDQGVLCPLNITHTMEYIVSGQLDPANCRFFITVTLKPEHSELVQNACSFDPPGGVSHFYVAPRTDEMQFTYELEKVKSESFTFYLTDVKLPQGVNCPSFVR